MTTSWQFTNIGELFEIGAGKSVTPQARNSEGRHPFLRTANVFWGRIDTSEIDAMHFSDQEIASKSLKKGDLLVCEGGDIGRAAIWNNEIENCSFQNHLHRLRPKNTDAVPYFYMYYLQAGFTRLGIYEGAGNKTTIPNLSRSRLESLTVPKPPKKEQEKIAALLHKVQEGIQVEENLIVTSLEMKQSAMKSLFTHGLHSEQQKDTVIGVLPESWAVVQINEKAKLIAGGTPSRTESEYWLGGTIPWVKTGEVNYCLINDTEEKITPIGMENSSAKLLPAGTLLVAMYGQGITRGKVAILGIDATTNQACVGLIPKDNDLLPKYLYYYLSYSYERLRSLSHGAQQQNLNKELVGSFQFPFPNTKKEQEEIAIILETIDKKIEVHKKKLKLLEELFQALLHVLMTEQVSAVDLEIDISNITS